MSKMDAMRAMREARYEQRAAGGAERPAVRMPTSQPAPKAAPPAEPAGAAGAREQLCGHRSMNGRTCTREHGHTAKSHRYS
jgi:hypothetical protein